MIEHDGSNHVAPLKTVKGKDLMGLKCKAPLTKYPFVYTLPMPTISMKKGTGVVTSVPSDAPDDFAMLRDLQTKKGLREKLGVEEEWVQGFDPIPILEIPEVGQMSAEFACNAEKVQSYKDKDKLQRAKEFTYKKGFYEGRMIVGVAEGKLVQDAKPLVRQHMIDSNLAASYSEPESPVISRQGEECVVALVDQWLLKYGEEEWRGHLLEHIKSANFNAYSAQCQAMFEDKVNWLKEWGCSRTYGLGTRVPWDEQFLIESLSDSTIYMAYYSIASFLQGPHNLDGTAPGPFNIAPEHMTHEVFDYIFLKGAYPADCQIAEELLARMRNEFEYWYPMDLRSSGKDLIPNHLTMCLYNHQAIWQDAAKLPRSFFCNGHIQVDGMKMSKNRGNFLTLKECLDRFGADATRFTCADSGDSLDDSNFETLTANSAIMKLFVLERWMLDELAKLPADLDWNECKPQDLWDAVLLYEMNACIRSTHDAYESMKFRDALKFGFYDMQSLKDDYVLARGGAAPNPMVILRFVEVQLLLLLPICPHFASKVWSEGFRPAVAKVKNFPRELPSSIDFALFPEETSLAGQPECAGLLKYWRQVKRELTLALQKTMGGGKKKKGGKKGGAAAPEEGKEEAKEKVSQAVFLVAKEYPAWKKQILEMLGTLEFANGKFQGGVVDKVKELFPEKDPKKVVEEVKFAKFMEEEFASKGKQALALETSFNEFKILEQAMGFILAETPVQGHSILAKEEPLPEALQEAMKGARVEASPGHPHIHLIK